MLNKYLPVIVPWPENVCSVCMALQPTDCICLSDLSTVCSEFFVLHATPLGSTHIIHIEVSHCWVLEFITHPL